MNKYFIILFVFFYFFDISNAFSEEKKISNANKQLQIIKVKKKEAEVKLKIAEKEARNLLFSIGKNKIEIRGYEKKIAQKELKIEKTQKALEKIIEVKDKAQKKLIERKKIFANRIISIYKVKNSHIVNSVLSSENINTMLKRYKYYSAIVKEDNKILKSIDKAKKYYKKTLNELYAKQTDLKDLVEVNNELKKKLVEKENSLKKLLESATKKKSLLENQIVKMNEETKILKDTITKQLKKDELIRKKELAAARLKEKQKQKKLNKIHKKVVNKGKIQMIWPVGNIDSVIAKYGRDKMSSIGIQRYNTGIDIMVPGIQKVKSSLDGIVIYKGFMNGYGNIIIIDHGNKLVTVYANLSSQEVGMNEYVKKGEIIGNTTKNEKFHFEVRNNSESEDPLKWLL